MRAPDYGSRDMVEIKGRVFVHDRNPGAWNVSVPCLVCSRMAVLADLLIDPAGPAFQAYYHEACVPDAPR